VKPGQIALTLDDGPYIYESGLIDTFNAAGIKATFFVNGSNWSCIYDYASELQKAFTSGHQIGCHTWSHPDITTLTNAQFDLELSKLETAFGKILGQVPTYFRPPYGSYNQNSLNVLQSRGYLYSVTWDVDSQDADGVTVAVAMNNLQTELPLPGNHIVLDHETQPYTISTLVPYLINYVKTNNLQAVTVAECLGDKYSPYRPSGTGVFGSKDSTWTC